MTDDHSDRVMRYFAGCARDVTPATVGDRAHVLYAPCSHDPDVTRLCASVLTKRERHRARRFARDADARSFIQRRAFRLFVGATLTGSARPLSEVRFDETATGRPYLAGRPDRWFSFSSSGGGLLAATSSEYALGVDLEDGSRRVDAVALARHFFAATEADAIERLPEPRRVGAFLRLWCLKEAALKSIGEGLPFGLAAFQFEPLTAPRFVRTPEEYGAPNDFSAHLIEHGETCAALVLRNLAPDTASQGDGVRLAINSLKSSWKIRFRNGLLQPGRSGPLKT